MLPDVDMDSYWSDIYGQPLHYWLETLEQVRAQHRLPLATATRFQLGRNVVFAWGSELVIKLVPPFWCPDQIREMTTLSLVQGKLEVATPEPVAVGELGSWGYLVMRYVPGEALGWDLSALSTHERIELARQQGELVRTLRTLEVPGHAQAALGFDWQREVDEQRQDLIANLHAAGVAPDLIATAAAYVDAAGDLAAHEHTFLHGDLSAINLMVYREDGRLSIRGLIDFSDAALGPAEHEYLSPVMHQFRGQPEVLAAFWEGVGVAGENERLQHRLMARSLLKYPELMPRYLSRLEVVPVRSWEDAAERFYRLT